jgi:hypothetical protein
LSNGRVERTFCSQRSRASSEERFGTASAILRNWFLLEYARPWTPDAVGGALLPKPVKKLISTSLAASPLSRVLLIKRDARPPDQITLFVALSTELNPRLYRFHFSTYEELLDLDVPALLAGDERYNNFRTGAPLFLVCTHGTHDMCCAKFGLPIYHALSTRLGEAVWQCSHVGGDRFAANILAFPHALYFGHVELEEAEPLTRAYHAGEIYLAKYRGRSCYPFPIQAAEYFLRCETATFDLAAFRLVDVERLASDRVVARFLCLSTGETHALEVATVESVFRNIVTCKSKQPCAVPQYRLLDYKVSGAG